MLPENFHFLRPDWLFAAPAIVPVLWLAQQSGAAASAWRRVCDPELFEHLVAKENARAPRWPLLALCAGWLVACLALAGPTWERLPQPSFQSPASSVLVVNLSPSMDATDVAPSRLGRARFEVTDALAALADEQLALVIFSEEPYTVTPLSDDPAVIGAQVPVLATRLMPGHGTRVDRAIDHASELLSRSGAPSGRILLITDGAGDDPDAAVDAAARAAAAGQRVSVLGVGTEEGAPLPGRRGFARDASGNAVVVRLERAALESIARAGHGRFAVATADDRDLHAVMPAADPVPGFAGELSSSKVKADAWRDMGAWLLVVPLLLAPLAFRKGWASALALLCFCGISAGAPSGASAGGLDDWLSRPDQQGARAFAEGRNAEAAKLFQDPAWQAAALYRAEDYAGAAQALRDQQGPEARYNLGNSLARAGQLQQALTAYDETLAAQPDHADARFNRDLVAKLLEEQKKQQQQDPQQQQGQQQQDQSQQQQNSAQQQDSKQQDSEQQNPQQGGSPQEQNQEQSGQQDAKQQQQQQGAEPDQQAKQGEQGEKDAQDEKNRQGSGAQTAEQAEQQSAEPQDAQAQAQQDGQKAEEPQPEQGRAAADAGDEQDAKSPKSAATAQENAGPQNERELALEQWLARIPDDPGGLLREKLRRQYAERRYGNR